MYTLAVESGGASQTAVVIFNMVDHRRSAMALLE
jgi:hypothetical protein